MTDPQDVTWHCPRCGKDTRDHRDEAGRPCWSCEPELIFEAQQDATRDEIDKAVAGMGNLQAIMRIRELTGCDTTAATGILHLRGKKERRKKNR